jgi:hypothetical protein
MAEGLALCLVMHALLPAEVRRKGTMMFQALVREAEQAANQPRDPHFYRSKACSSSSLPQQLSGPAPEAGAGLSTAQEEMLALSATSSMQSATVVFHIAATISVF